jgi:dimethylaniline monooxygenase (N-oxide forming)
MQPKPEHVDVVVVGAGWNGLISAKTFLDFVPDANLALLDNQATIGGVWSKQNIYPTLFAQIKIGQFEYSFYPMKKENITNDGYIGASTIHGYLNDFARDFDLVRRARLRTQVDKVERRDDGLWQLAITTVGDDGVARGSVLETPRLIYATGATSHPVLPQWPRDAAFTAPTVHSRDVGQHLTALRAVKRATVVGAAKSAYDIVFSLLQQGIKVDWLIREDGSGPLAIMPPKIGLLNTLDVASTGLVAAFSANIMNTSGAAYSLLHASSLGRTITTFFWRWLTGVAASHAGYAKSANAAKLTPEPHGEGIHWANAGLGTASVPDFWKVFHAGDCTVHRTEIASLDSGNKVTLKDGKVLDTEYIIMCTGFDKSYHQFSADLQEECGLVPPAAAVNASEAKKWASLEADAEHKVNELFPGLAKPPAGLASAAAKHHADEGKLLHGPSLHYRRLVVPGLASAGDRSVYFPGFIHTIYTPLVSEVQALWGVGFMLGLVDLPARAEMEREVAEWNVWTRKRYLAQGRKHAYAIYDFFAYIDVLLKDMGIRTQRKSNALAELFMPKYPREYNGLVHEFRTALAAKHPRGYDIKK